MKRETKAALKARARNICLTVAYDGTCYHGFQRQTNGVVAVQNVLEKALGEVFGDATIEVTAAGRTDTGVHAAGQVVNFFTDGKIPADKIPCAVNAYLPGDIAVLSAKEAPKDFSALHDAKSKIYTYTIYNAPVRDPLRCRYAWHVERPLDTAPMSAALDVLRGEHDFSSFRAAGSTGGSSVRELYSVALTAVKLGEDDEKVPTLISTTVHGNGFLYHMVRNIIGSLVYVGRGRFTVEDFAALLRAHDRTQGAPTAPAEGLCLQEVRY